MISSSSSRRLCNSSLLSSPTSGSGRDSELDSDSSRRLHFLYKGGRPVCCLNRLKRITSWVRARACISFRLCISAGSLILDTQSSNRTNHKEDTIRVSYMNKCNKVSSFMNLDAASARRSARVVCRQGFLLHFVRCGDSGACVGGRVRCSVAVSSGTLSFHASWNAWPK